MPKFQVSRADDESVPRLDQVQGDSELSGDVDDHSNASVGDKGKPFGSSVSTRSSSY